MKTMSGINFDKNKMTYIVDTRLLYKNDPIGEYMKMYKYDILKIGKRIKKLNKILNNE